MAPRLIKLMSLFTGAAMLGVPEAYAATATGALPAQVDVASGCQISALPLSFGTYDLLGGTAAVGSTTLQILCTVGTIYNVGLNAGTGTGATVAVRKMTSGINRMNYSLYQDTNYTVLWGNTIGTNTYSGTYAAGQPDLRVYGRVPSGQTLPAGTYTDTITVTLTY